MRATCSGRFWPGLAWHKHHAVELLGVLSADSVPCDARIDAANRSNTELAAVERSPGIPVTARNWNTVDKLATMVEEA